MSAPVWQHGFAGLGETFHTPCPPQALSQPYWVAHNPLLARSLGLGDDWMNSSPALALFSGQTTAEGTRPLASVYAGHQFGVWAGRLGDGRALLLGELTDVNGVQQEIQLKGSGRTPYSRMGDGRAVLRSSIREFLCSEAMHGLGIPTTRALCLAGSDDLVFREEAETAAVLTRVAPSFLRFGHFEYFSHLHRALPSEVEHGRLRQLADWFIHRHPDICEGPTDPGPGRYSALLRGVARRTAELLAQWQAVGFCHGVMNTDNMSLLGLTIDYGPFQFLDAFDPGHICNHSDNQGRYAFERQPNVAYWNLHALAQALLPLIEDPDVALAALEPYKSGFAAALMLRLRAKLGLTEAQETDGELVNDILRLMAQDHADYTIFWRRLSHWVAQTPGSDGDEMVRDLFMDRPSLDAWLQRYTQRLTATDRAAAGQLMLRTNPKFVLRNHLAELTIRQAREKDYSGVQRLLHVLQCPYDEHPQHEAYAGFPPSWAATLTLSCSS